MKNEIKEMENKIKDAVEHITPDVLDGILSKCEAGESAFVPVQTVSVKPKRKYLRLPGLAAAVLVLVLTGFVSYFRIENYTAEALVMLDVNPSIEIKVNKRDRVIDVTAMNEDAVKIMDNMDLRGTQINVAINALVGSMLKYGYIRENANSVLLSVGGGNAEKAVLLQRNLADSISQQLSAVNGSVISQQLSSDSEIKMLAEEHQISSGKAALVQKIIAENNHLLFADLAKLSVNELNLLVGSKQIAAEGMEAKGRASDTDFIGDEAAALIALDHAGLSDEDVRKISTEFDYDDGAMTYEVEFDYGGKEYEYEIDATSGEILSLETEDDD